MSETTIGVTPQLRKKLNKLKVDLDYKNVAEVVDKLLKVTPREQLKKEKENEKQ